MDVREEFLRGEGMELLKIGRIMGEGWEIWEVWEVWEKTIKSLSELD
ncbi:MAG: hypothetical protein ACYC9O_21435 [Candidatus Latescibacterota bacterium]